ncbi:Os12g0482300 [Oryza sativa Japonica Group]|uniref:Os12g0481601 protein n=2 Tax=Oryza sativa subsp. japonica TaxID=39947 RepID=A3CHC6_ORYSJ|nr:hypothetical protein OsJ_36096 [Oryza sativa Japonica Group]KAF2907819.1 hypothetical protein DAI22_12g128900 [Oryza sativa Japonica Group]BAT17146.1 Os12g0481601 [Oryza sativa Japonica Group]BAT17148.1 Os12g0481900 [Oryza sativa Japonica Group]BAT17150.1 Os12g0482300 [Oryza sativa Japonica Group]
MDPSAMNPSEEGKALGMDPSGQGKALVIQPAVNPSGEGEAPVMEEKKKKKTTTTKKKTKTMRFTQEQINNCIAYKDVEIPFNDNMPSLLEALGEETLANFPQDLIDKLKAYEDEREAEKASFIEIQNHIRGERDGILNQYYTKGYAEYEVVVDDDGEEDSKVPPRIVAPPGRRRFRNGVTVKKNQSGGGGSVRKI